jgi:hypothetical protein
VLQQGIMPAMAPPAAFPSFGQPMYGGMVAPMMPGMPPGMFSPQMGFPTAQPFSVPVSQPYYGMQGPMGPFYQ